MNDEHDICVEKKSEQIDKYLQSSVSNQQHQMSFDEIMIQFIIDDPDRARIFSSDSTSRLAFSLLRQTAILFEQFFPELDFKNFLALCIKNDCHPRRVCNLTISAYPATEHAFFKSIIDAICHALVIYDNDTHVELRPDYLSKAQFYFAELYMVNINQRNKAKKSRSDALSELISTIVENNPKITEDQLLQELPGYEIIEEIEDGCIYFKQNYEQGKAKTSGLKDRLSRAKKKLTPSV